MSIRDFLSSITQRLGTWSYRGCHLLVCPVAVSMKVSDWSATGQRLVCDYGTENDFGEPTFENQECSHASVAVLSAPVD